MKNWLKLLIPVLLGIGAAGINFWAMEIGSSTEYVQLVGPLKEGELLESANLHSVRIKFGGEGLKLAAVPYKDRSSLLKLPVKRALEKGDLVLWQDVGRITSEPKLTASEVAVDLALSDFNYDPALLKVGNRVGFYVLKAEPPQAGPEGGIAKPDSTGRSATEGVPTSAAPAGPQATKGELLGPFRVVSVGARTDEERGLLDKDNSGKTPVNLTVAVTLDATTKKVTPLGDSLILAKSNRPGEPGSIRSMVLYGNE